MVISACDATVPYSGWRFSLSFNVYVERVAVACACVLLAHYCLRVILYLQSSIVWWKFTFIKKRSARSFLRVIYFAVVVSVPCVLLFSRVF